MSKKIVKTHFGHDDAIFFYYFLNDYSHLPLLQPTTKSITTLDLSPRPQTQTSSPSIRRN